MLSAALLLPIMTFGWGLLVMTAVGSPFGRTGHANRSGAELTNGAGFRPYDRASPDLDDGADVASIIRLVAQRSAPALASCAVTLDIAVQGGLTARMRPGALTVLLADLLDTLLRHASGSRMLITGVAQGDHVCIRVADDHHGADVAELTARLRGLSANVSMHGARLDIEVQHSAGTTVTLRLASPIRDFDRDAAAVRYPSSAYGSIGDRTG